MGILFENQTEFKDWGLSLSNAVLTFNGKVEVNKLFDRQIVIPEKPYRLTGRFDLWASMQAYQSRNQLISPSKPIIKNEPVNIDISEEDLDGNLLGLLYGKMKELFPNATDM